MHITDLLDQLGVPYKRAGEHENVSQGWVGIDCPKCTPNAQRWRLGVNLSYGYASCWVCGRQNLAWVLAGATGKPFRELQTLLGDIAHATAPERPRGTLRLPDRLGPLLKPHKRYLRQRGYDPDAIQRLWGIQGIAYHTRTPWCIWIPVHRRGQVVSWTTRSLSDEHTGRYHAAAPHEEAWPHKEVLYGADMARHAIVCCEGPLDAWRIGPGAVCTFGTGYSMAQLKEMAGFPLRIIAYDAEDAAQARARRLCSSLAVFPGQTINIELETGKDPGDASTREIQLIRQMLGGV